MVQIHDPLDVLLPGNSEASLRRARNVVQFLRLLAADAQSSRALSVGVGLDRARIELETQARDRLGSVLRDLLRHHLVALASADTFLAWGEPSLTYGAAWRVLDEYREEHSWLPEVPGPADPAARIAASLLECVERLLLPADEVALWRSRILRFVEGPRAAETHLRAGLEVGGPERGGAGIGEAELGACLVECLLDRGAVREARTWLQDHAACTGAVPRLRQLLSWTLLCLGDYAGAKSAIVGLPVFAGILPAGLADLRADRPEWLPCLAGRAAQDSLASSARAYRAAAACERAEAGAVLLAVFAIGPGGQTIAVHVDAAPALRSAIPTWLADRDGAYSVPGENEHELVIRARPVTVRKEGAAAISGALGRDSSLALALAPILDEHGEVAGWVHVECEHHRLPSRCSLAAMARSWRGEVLSRTPRPAAVLGAEDERPRSDWSGGVADLAPQCAAVFEALVADLGIKTAQRKWWGFALEATEIRLVATGGEGSGLSPGARGNGRAVTRAAATRSRVSFELPDARLALDERAASGVVLPLLAEGDLCGLLAIESSRRRDFREADLARIARTTESRGLALKLARFAAWHRRKFGFEVWFEAGVPGFRAFAGRLCAAAARRSPVVFIGPGGVGKTVLSRWLHFESPRSDAPLRFVDCATLASRDDLRGRFDASPEGTLVLEGLEELPPEGQEELLRRLEGREIASGEDSAAVRIVGTMCAGTGTGGDEKKPRIREDLARRLDRVQIRIAPLRERRGDVLKLVAGFARRFAEEENVRTPWFSDETLALLWRQPWDGNARELENFVYKLVVFGPGRKRGPAEVVEPLHLQEISNEFGLRLVARLPSRHPSRTDLLSALRITRKPGGRLNKTRAALYLGWDPDTLVARMQDAGIGEELLESADDAGWKSDASTVLEECETPVSNLASDRLSAPLDSSVARNGATELPLRRGEGLASIPEGRTSEQRTDGDEAGPTVMKGEGPRALHDAHGP